MSKIAPELNALYEQYCAYLVSHPAGAFLPADPLMRVIKDRVQIAAIASNDPELLKCNLESLGIEEAFIFGRIVSGQLPIFAIPAMATLVSLQLAKAAYGAIRRGSIDSFSRPPAK